MTRAAIHHLAVIEGGRLVGVISTYDLLRLQAAHPVALAREISRAPSLSVLADLAERITPLVRHLMSAGGSPYDIGQIVAELNDRLAQRILGLTADGLAATGEIPPVPFCWLALGSEARREQTLRTDLDNGLVYADPPPELAARAATYYARFAEASIQGLVKVGFPPCPADLMASNPEWRQPLSVWSGYFQRWLTEAWPAQTAAAVVLFDLRPIAGDQTLADALLHTIRTEAPRNRAFLSLLARDAIADDAPVTLWGRVVVERHGPHRGALDVKQAAVQQLVGAGRVHALEQLRRQAGRASVADPGGRSWIRSLLVIPMDYGVLCLSFLSYGVLPVFVTVYTLIFAATAAFLASEPGRAIQARLRTQRRSEA